MCHMLLFYSGKEHYRERSGPFVLVTRPGMVVKFREAEEGARIFNLCLEAPGRKR